MLHHVLIALLTVTVVVGTGGPVAAQTGTQSGVRGDPNRCPPPHPGAKNWSCRTSRNTPDNLPQVGGGPPTIPPECQVEVNAAMLRQQPDLFDRILNCALGAQPAQAAGGRPTMPGLWVGGEEVTSADQIGLQRLTGIRREIVDAMIDHPSRIFDFADKLELEKTVELRWNIIQAMEARRRGPNNCTFGGTLQVPDRWRIYTEPEAPLNRQAAMSVANLRADQAIEAFRRGSSVVDCLAGMEITLLDAAYKTLGGANFVSHHPVKVWPHLAQLPQDSNDAGFASKPYALVGLGVPLAKVKVNGDAYSVSNLGNRSSVAKHLIIARIHARSDWYGERSLDRGDDPDAGRITVADMVPGDYAYLENVPQYHQDQPDGDWTGENAFYLGTHVDRTGAGRRLFYGFGFDQEQPFLTEAELRQALVKEYNDGRGVGTRAATVDHAEWTVLGGPTLLGNPRHAGCFAMPSGRTMGRGVLPCAR